MSHSSWSRTVTTARLIATLATHWSLVLFVSFGALLILLWPPLLRWHAAIAIGTGVWMSLRLGCPFTGIEKRLREQLGLPVYQTSFMKHYIYHHLGRHGEAIWTAMSVSTTLGVYAFVFFSL